MRGMTIMPRRQRNPYLCPACGTHTEPKKTWQLTSPFPDSKGRITGSFECPKCGHKWRAVVSKIKVGGDSVEVEASGKKAGIQDSKAAAKREGPVFEIDIDEE